MGGFYGGILCKSGKEVDFLARSDIQHIKQFGIKVDSPLGNFTLNPVSVFSSSVELPETDVIIIATKTTSNHLLPKLISPIVRKDTIILVMQNGLGMEAELKLAFPQARVIAGMCFICTQKPSPGYVRHIDKGAVLLSPLNTEDAPLLEIIQADFMNAGIECTCDLDLVGARWKKLLWNIPFNGMSVVLNADTKKMLSCESGITMARELMKEVIMGADACGSILSEQVMEDMIEFTGIMEPYEPSMKLDYVQGRPMEVHYMYHRPIRAAAEHGVRLPKVEMLAAQLDFLNEKNLVN